MATEEKEPRPDAQTHGLRSNMEFQPREPPMWQIIYSNWRQRIMATLVACMAETWR